MCLSAVIAGSGAVALARQPALETAAGIPSIWVGDGQTRVLVASVYLTVGKLTLEDGALVGQYTIRVPLRPAKNDAGSLRLPISDGTRLADLLREGGVLTGTGKSHDLTAPTRYITCRVIPAGDGGQFAMGVNGRIALAIDTGDRVVQFDCDFRLLGELAALNP